MTNQSQARTVVLRLILLPASPLDDDLAHPQLSLRIGQTPSLHGHMHWRGQVVRVWLELGYGLVTVIVHACEAQNRLPRPKWSCLTPRPRASAVSPGISYDQCKNSLLRYQYQYAPSPIPELAARGRSPGLQC